MTMMRNIKMEMPKPPKRPTGEIIREPSPLVAVPIVAMVFFILLIIEICMGV